MGFIIFISRILFSAIFISSGINHLTNTQQMSEYAANKKVPVPTLSVLLSGLMLLFGGISIFLWVWVNVGAFLLILFLIPAALLMHNFWIIEDPVERQNEQIHFLKDLALAGAAFLIWYLYTAVGNVPWSLSDFF